MSRASEEALVPLGSDALVRQLHALGVETGDVLLVHTAYTRVAPIAGGPSGLIAALRTAVGAEGTLVMPSMSDDDEVPFDPDRTPCLGMGVVADTFWRTPHVLRSPSPHAFAATGPDAPGITEPHPVTIPHGMNSPVGRVLDLDGKVLLLGVHHDANTTIHLAETIAGVRYRQAKQAMVLAHGQPVRIAYDEIDHCCQNFVLVDRWLDAAGLQRHGVVGYGDARLARSRDVVATVLSHLREDPLIFLHEAGTCHECSDARASLLRT